MLLDFKFLGHTVEDVDGRGGPAFGGNGAVNGNRGKIVAADPVVPE